MKINEKFIDDIFKNKIKIKNKADKIKLAKYQDLIPMYDIYTQRIYPINKENLFYRLTESNYRFINHEVYKWINQLYDKNKDKLKLAKGEEKIQIEILLKRLKSMIDIIDNYDIDTLIDISYKVLYHHSTALGLSVSICKRNSFNPFIFYLKPYYTKIELIKLGQNMGIIKKHIKTEELLDVATHYDICKKISNSDVSFEEIKNHTISILNDKTISDIVFYSFIGSTLLNRFLRMNDEYELNKFFYDKLINIVDSIKKAPELENDYQTYRFISDDSFLKELDIGDTFIDKGFLSSTRDPFYSPGMKGNFGLILIKINFKKGMRGGLFIEHFSLFPKEEEFLIPPLSKLKLVSKDNNFKYYHVNETFEKSIYKKYEFDFVSVDYSWIKKVKKINEEIPVLDLSYLDSDSVSTKMELLNKIKNSSNKFNEIEIMGKVFKAFFFDSSDSYRKFYLNKVEKGLSLIYFDKFGNPSIFIELGKELIVNYINQFYFYNEKEIIDEKFLIDLIMELGYHLKYKTAIIYNDFTNYSQFKSNYYTNQEVFLYLNLFNNTLYQYLKNNKKPFSFEIFYVNKFKKLELILNKKLSDEDKERFNCNGNTLKELLIETIENNFYQYSQVISHFQLEEYNNGELNINEKLISMGKVDTMLKLEYTENEEDDDEFKLLYRQPLRR